MSNVKNLLGEMDFEELEVTCKSVYDKLNSIENHDITEQYSEDARQLYNYWLNIGGKVIIEKWINDRGGYIEHRVDECLTYMWDEFMGWLKGFVN